MGSGGATRQCIAIVDTAALGGRARRSPAVRGQVQQKHRVRRQHGQRSGTGVLQYHVWKIGGCVSRWNGTRRRRVPHAFKTAIKLGVRAVRSAHRTTCPGAASCNTCCEVRRALSRKAAALRSSVHDAVGLLCMVCCGHSPHAN